MLASTQLPTFQTLGAGFWSPQRHHCLQHLGHGLQQLKYQSHWPCLAVTKKDNRFLRQKIIGLSTICWRISQHKSTNGFPSRQLACASALWSVFVPLACLLHFSALLFNPSFCVKDLAQPTHHSETSCCLFSSIGEPPIYLKNMKVAKPPSRPSSPKSSSHPI